MQSLSDFEKELVAHRVEFVTIRAPHHGSRWQVNLRDGPGWAAGPHCETFAEAIELAIKNFRKEWADKRSNRITKAPESDPLGDLLG